ncbi:MAG: FUSC family protein [Sphingomonas sp.]
MPRRLLRNRHIAKGLGWTAHEPVGVRVMLGAAIGVAVPAAIGLLAGRPAIGFAVAMGATLFGGPEAAERSSEQGAGRRSLTEIFASALFVALAPPIATLCTRWSWGDELAIAIVTMLAAVSGHSRPFAVAAMRFIVFLVMSMSIASQSVGNPGGVALLLGLGAIWGAIIRVGLRPAKASEPEPSAMATRNPTRPQRIMRLKRVLRTAEGWQYPIRLALALGLSSIIRHVWPDQHFSWVLVTVALLVERQPEALPVKTTQRALGVVVGVALTGLVLAELRSPLAIAAVVCLLATLRPWLRARNYLAYSAVMTPLVLLVMDLGTPIGGAVLIDRLIATLLGAAIVIAVNLLAVRFLVPKPIASQT